MRTFLTLLILGGFGLLAGCANTRAPSVTVLGATVTETTDEATRLELTLQLENPNDESLEIVEYAYRVRMEGGKAYTGRRAGMATMGAGSTSEIMLPAVIVGTPDPAALWSIKGTVQYLRPGALSEILFDAGVQRPKARFSGKKSDEATKRRSDGGD